MGRPTIDQPQQPTVGGTAREALQAQVDLFPRQFQLQQQYAPQLADLGVDVFRRTFPELLQIQQQTQPIADELAAQSARHQRRADLGDVAELGPVFSQAFKAANPDYTQVQGLLSSLASGVGRRPVIDSSYLAALPQAIGV